MTALTMLTDTVSPRRDGRFRSIWQQRFATHLQNLWHSSTAAIHWVRTIFRKRNCSATQGRCNHNSERITHANTYPAFNVYTLLLPIVERSDMLYNSCKYLP
jgi:hypothetical protein